MKRSRANDDAEINNLSKHFKSTLTLTLGNSLAPSTQAEINATQARIHAAGTILCEGKKASNEFVEHIDIEALGNGSDPDDSE
ncbi:hypothetical protein Megvenef_00768 [Candidatus Megaera venefica]|uniref:Uncharacterized protein n=1 Tax=Candidatus Megaera venefica TaxID=2055910 RepID=A0ABU5NC91_9RICK|nr:hypothetical protein [Candidatus Megaera venefica]MEA0970799.1 hypothetical protein [Candidatus Megaera venefica]